MGVRDIWAPPFRRRRLGATVWARGQAAFPGQMGATVWALDVSALP